MPATALANGPPHAPTLVAPAAGATLSANAPQLFMIQTSDPDGDSYSGWVTVTNTATGQPAAAFATSLAPSGQVSVGVPFTSLAAGNYTWTASASDLPYGLAGAEAAPQSFSVSGSPDIGGGAFTGKVSYSPALPAVGKACGTTNFSVNATSAAAVISFAPTPFAGFLNFSGSGGSACENASSGTGSLSLSASGLGATATTIECASLTGGYTRTATHLRGVVSGACTINESATDTVSFAIEADLIPNGGGGAVGPLTQADFDGELVVSPGA